MHAARQKVGGEVGGTAGALLFGAVQSVGYRRRVSLVDVATLDCGLRVGRRGSNRLDSKIVEGLLRQS